LLAGQTPRVLVRRTADLAAVDARLDELEALAPTRASAMQAALSLALGELAGSLIEARRVLVLSDGAAHERLDALRATPGVRLDVERFGPASDASVPANVAIASADATLDPTDATRASVLVTLRAFGSRPERPVAVRLEQRGSVRARGDAIFRDDMATVTLVAPLPPPGTDPTARVVIETSDALAADDTRGVLLRSAGGLRFLLAGTDASTNAVARALALAPQRDGPLAIRRVDPDTLATIDWNTVDAALLVDMPAPSAELAASLRRFVERGGGLALAPGDATEVRALGDALGKLLPARVTHVQDTAEAPGLRPGDAPERADDPRASLRDATGLRDVRVVRRLALDTPREGALVALRFADGAPALVVGEAGAGRMALVATTLDETWSDLPLRPGFLPLVSRLVHAIAAESRAPARAVLPGETLSLGLPPGAARLTLTDPSGARADFDDARTATISDTALPGAYRVEVADEGGAPADATRLAFVVAPPLEESDLRPGPDAASQGNAEVTKAGTTGVRRSLTPWLFLLAGLLAVAEGALRFRWRRSETPSPRAANA